MEKQQVVNIVTFTVYKSIFSTYQISATSTSMQHFDKLIVMLHNNNTTLFIL
jgi:hypothetical protein